MKTNDEGFTLIELLIVIVILGILAAVVVFAVGGITDRGKDSACKADRATLEVAVEAYYAQAGEFPDNLNSLTTNINAESPTITTKSLKLLNDVPEYVKLADANGNLALNATNYKGTTTECGW